MDFFYGAGCISGRRLEIMVEEKHTFLMRVIRNLDLQTYVQIQVN